MNCIRKNITLVVVFTVFVACFAWFKPIMEYRFLAELEGKSIETAQIFKPIHGYPLIQRG